MSIDLVPLWADKRIKLIGLMTITMKKNNSDQTKGKPWTESVKTNWGKFLYGEDCVVCDLGLHQPVLQTH